MKLIIESKNINFKFISIYIISHLTFILILKNSTILAPDEISYTQLANRIHSNFDDETIYRGFSYHARWILYIIYLPIKLMTYLGIETLFSLRLMSLSLSLIAFLVLLHQSKDQLVFNLNKKYFIYFISFIPTIFIWNSLAIRESFILLWLVFLFYGISHFSSTQSLTSVLIVITSSYLLFMTKPYLYILFLISLSICLSLKKFLKFKFKAPYIFFICLIPIIIGYEQTSDVIKIAKSEFSNISEVQSSQLSSGKIVSVEDNLPMIDDGFLIDNFKSSKLLNLFNTFDPKNKYIDKFRFDQPKMIFSKTIQFLFLPSPFYPNGSIAANFASLEAPLLWLFYIFYFKISFQGLRKKLQNNLPFLLSGVYALVFIFFSAIVETNVGTFLRHRAVLMFLILIYIIYYNISETPKAKFLQQNHI